MEVFSPRPSAPELPLVGTMPSSDPVHIRNVTGLDPVKANIISTPFASGRGELYQGSSTPKRNIVLTLGLSPDWEDQTISSLRQLLYAYFMPEMWTKLRFFSDNLPTVEIEGYVESFEANMFSQDPEMVVSILCPKPDFLDVDVTLISGVVDDGSLETAFTYIGTVATGFELRVTQSIDNPAYTGLITLTRVEPSLQIFAVEDVTVDGVHYFKMNSVKNSKRVQSIAVADGAATNLLTQLTDISVWPELEPGENVFTVEAAENDQEWTLAYFNRFGGL